MVDLNNRLRQYQIAERNEIQRILSELSAELVPHRQEIIHNAYVIGKMDMMNEKALFGKELKAIVPGKRILSELSAELVPHRQEIIHNAYVIGKMDLMNAKARFGKELKAIVPGISEDNHVVLKQARHPLIDQEKVVPNDIAIGKDYQAIVITGPNTGGKTITLKTLGMLLLMGQAGLPIPASSHRHYRT